MSSSLSPEDLAWLRQCAAVDGNTYDRLLLHLLERLEALEAAQQQPHKAKLDRLIALDRDDDEPTPEAAPKATLRNALLSAEAALSDIAEGEETNAAPNTFKWAEQRCAEALATIRPVMQQHGIRTSEYPPAAQRAPLVTPYGATDEQAAQQQPNRDKIDLLIALGRDVPPASQPALPGRVVEMVLRELPPGTDPRYARHAIRAVARWLRSELNGRNVAERLELEVDR